MSTNIMAIPINEIELSHGADNVSDFRFANFGMDVSASMANDNDAYQAQKDAVAILERKSAIRHNEDAHMWRELYFARSFYLVGFVIYSSMLFLMFTAAGLFKLSDAVLITLLTTTVANVIGMLMVGFGWLFRKNLKEENND